MLLEEAIAIKLISLLFTLTLSQNIMTLFDFNAASDISDWNIVDDVVMGGRSNSTFDGKFYQFRIKTNTSDSCSYVASFNTTKNWQTIEIPFASMYPAFRGQKLNAENYPGKQMEQIAFLIGNKIAESFKLEIERIILK